MNILFVGHTQSVFVKELIRNLLKNYSFNIYVFDILTGVVYDVAADINIIELPAISKMNSISGKWSVFQRMRKMAEKLKESGLKFEVCHVHYVDARYFFIRKTLFHLSRKIYVSVYGSEFNKHKKSVRLQVPYYKKASVITFTNQQLADKFISFFQNQFAEKIRICRFGLSLLDSIKEKSHSFVMNDIKRIWSVPSDKAIILVGYSSNPNSRHIEIIEELLKLPTSLQEKLFIIFPMTYGGYSEQIQKVESRINSTAIEFLILKEFLSNDKLAELRLMTDIMIHLPMSDQLSGAMQENLYAGNIVVTGKWLPYEVFDKLGIYYFRLESLGDLNNLIPKILDDLDSEKKKTAVNRDIIWTLSSWENNIADWNKLYSALT